MIGINTIGIGTRPIKFPSQVKGIITPITANKIDEKYTNLCALLSINGSLAVLIICIPSKLDTILYENHMVWKVGASCNLKTNNSMAKTIISKIELIGPINNINFFKLFILNLLGFFKYSSSTLSKGKVS